MSSVSAPTARPAAKATTPTSVRGRCRHRLLNSTSKSHHEDSSLYPLEGYTKSTKKTRRSGKELVQRHQSFFLLLLSYFLTLLRVLRVLRAFVVRSCSFRVEDA